MRTSSAQYDLLVTYCIWKNMEISANPLAMFVEKQRHSDGGRSSSGFLMPTPPTGDSKSLDKWRKVWSDFKTNTKRKAAKLHRAASGTGGGPAVHARLSDLESRVLSIVGMQAATGISSVEEAGLFLSPVDSSVLPFQPAPVQAEEVNIETEFAEPLPPTIHPVISSPIITTEDPVALPSPSGRTPRRRSGRRSRPFINRRHVRNVDEASQSFLNSDEQWRSFKEQQHKDWMDFRREQLENQNGWQAVANRALDIMEKYLNK